MILTLLYYCIFVMFDDQAYVADIEYDVMGFLFT